MSASPRESFADRMRALVRELQRTSRPADRWRDLCLGTRALETHLASCGWRAIDVDVALGELRAVVDELLTIAFAGVVHGHLLERLQHAERLLEAHRRAFDGGATTVHTIS